MSKRCFTLMEVLIGFALASIVLGLLLSSLVETSMISSRLEKAEGVILSRAELQQRLSSLFGNLIDSGEQRQTPVFLVEEEGIPPVLEFMYRSGIDLSPHFSKTQSGKLVQSGNTLEFEACGNILVGKETPSSRTETLRRGVKKIDYEFLEGGEIFLKWAQEREFPPSLLKLTLHMDEGNVEEFVFWINKDPEGVIIK